MKLEQSVFQSITCLILLTTIACSNKKTPPDPTKIVSEWVGKKINIPQGLPCSFMGMVDTACTESAAPYRILLYVDSTGCASCKLQLYKWDKLMEIAKRDMPGQLQFSFYFQPRDPEELQYLCEEHNFRHIINIDKLGQLNTLNNFPEHINFKCFLLDADNNVLVIGNPVINPKIWELYKTIIRVKKSDRV